MNKIKPEYYSTKQVAELLSVHPMTVTKWIQSGKLESIKIGTGVRGARRIPASAIDKLINGDNEQG